MMPSQNAVVTEPHTCFGADCKSDVRWGVESSVKKRDFDGSPLTLYACDDHERILTAQLRTAKTRYRLFPVETPVATPVEAKSDGEKAFDERVAKMSPFGQLMSNVLVVVVCIVIAPFIAVYYGVKWIAGWRPAKNG